MQCWSLAPPAAYCVVSDGRLEHLIDDMAEPKTSGSQLMCAPRASQFGSTQKMTFSSGEVVVLPTFPPKNSEQSSEQEGGEGEVCAFLYNLCYFLMHRLLMPFFHRSLPPLPHFLFVFL